MIYFKIVYINKLQKKVHFVHIEKASKSVPKMQFCKDGSL